MQSVLGKSQMCAGIKMLLNLEPPGRFSEVTPHRSSHLYLSS